MQQFLYRLQATRLGMLTGGPTPSEAAAAGEHFAYLQALAAKGVVMMAGRTLNNDERTFGITVFVAENEKAAEAIVQADPAVKSGVMRAELFPYHVAAWSPKIHADGEAASTAAGSGSSPVKRYMVIERFSPGCKAKVYERFHEKGRMLPEGLTYVDSWLEREGDRCFQLMETDNPKLFDAWFEKWQDVVSMEVVEIGEKPAV
jgi:uncharacterized protein YciI